MNDTSQKLAYTLANANWFNRLVEQSKVWQKLQHLFNQVVADDMARACRIIHFENESLIIGAKNASWAAKLRYLAPELRKQLKKFPEFARLKTLESKVISPDQSPTLVSRKMQLSVETCQRLTECGQAIKDPQLKEMLLRLANTVSR